MESKKLICNLCNVPLTPQKTEFHYLGHTFSADIPKCPKCGQVYIPEDLVTGKMAQVEMQLEDK